MTAKVLASVNGMQVKSGAGMEKKGKNTMSSVLSVLNLRWQRVSSVGSSSLIPNGIYSSDFQVGNMGWQYRPGTPQCTWCH